MIYPLPTRIVLCSALLLAVTGSLTMPAVSQKERNEVEENLHEIVEYLLDYVAGSDCLFIRNNREYSAEKAAGHIRKKYEHYEDEITTAEDFIRLAATKSMMSGKPYLVRFKDGIEIPCSDWLTVALAAYRARADSLGGALAKPDSSDQTDQSTP